MAELLYLNLLPADWEEWFSRATVKAGHACQQTGKVLSCDVNPAESEIIASIKGFGQEHYTVKVKWGADEVGEEFIEGECSCPKAFNCVHVVAAIVEALGLTGTPGVEPPKPKLAQQVQTWLQQLQQATAPPPPEPEGEPADEPERLAYILGLERAGYNYNYAVQKQPEQLTVKLQVVRKLVNGGYGAGRNVYSEYVLNNLQRPPCVRNVDVSIVRRLKMSQSSALYYGTNVLAGEDGAALLEEILRTGRCYWRGTGKKHPALSLGAPRLAKLEWKADTQGMQSPGLDVTPTPTAFLPLVPPWYLDEQTGTCGVLDTGLPPTVAAAWFNAPTLTPDQAELLGEELVRRYPDLHVPTPQRIEVETVNDLKPVPCLRLYSQPVSQQNYGYYYGRSRGLETMDLNLARVEFDYEGTRIMPGEPGTLIESFHDGKLRRIQRNKKFELLQFSLLTGLGFRPAREEFFNYRLGKQADALVLSDANAWFAFCQNTLPELRADGWRVEVDESFRFRLAEPENWYADATESSGIDWFGVEIGVQLDGQKLNLLPILLDQIQRNPKLLSEEGLAAHKNDAVLPIQLPDGRVLPFPVRRLKEMLGVLLELFDPKSLDRGGRLRMSKLRAAELSKIAGGSAEWRWMGGKELSDLSRKLHDFSGIKPVVVSPNLRAVLRGYQQEGLNWLQFLREYSLAGILADDMGLGKTVQALAHLLHERESGRMDHPSLVVAPTSLMTNWRQEAERFAPGVKVLVLHGLDRKQHFDKLKEYDLIITSYPLLPRDQAILFEQEFHYVILDEAQFIKNPKTQYA
ncbi:MAG: family helicase, partial [Pedosphaera sp.]|nr:family helicase [Pedosphaera sp.]